LQRILHGGASALVGHRIGLLVSVISLPLTVRDLRPERYGIWVTVSTSVVMLAVMDLGVANSLTNLVSRAYAQGDRQFARRAYASPFWISTVVPCLLALVARILWLHINWSSVFQFPGASTAVRHSFASPSRSPSSSSASRSTSSTGFSADTGRLRSPIYFNVLSNLLGLVAIVAVIARRGSLLNLMCFYSAMLSTGTVF
jgi:hypothetical protein